MAATSNNISFGESLCEFSFSLYNEIDKADNFCLSPFSLSATLLLLILGTDGMSRSQLERVIFKHGYPTEDVEKAYKNVHNGLLDRTSEVPGMQLGIVNQLFVAELHVNRIKYQFRKKARYDFGCHVGIMDFGHEPYTRNIINKWIEETTGRKIKNFIPEGMLNYLTFMVLTNVIYFKGEWNNKFDIKRTSQRDFWVNNSTKTSTDMMYKKFKVKAAVDKYLDCKAVELPYKGGNISMVVILPNEIEGLYLLEKKMSVTSFEELIKKLEEQETEVVLPKFKVRTNIDLKQLLSGLGIRDIFDSNKADFSKMVRPHDQYGDLYVSNAIHESFIEVNEEGSEATAATAFILSFRSALPKPFQFIANHPFIFVVRDMQSGAILFLGRYSNPYSNQIDNYKIPEMPVHEDFQFKNDDNDTSVPLSNTAITQPENIADINDTIDILNKGQTHDDLTVSANANQVNSSQIKVHHDIPSVRNQSENSK